MDRGTPALIMWLMVASAVLILFITGLVELLARSDSGGSWLHVAWTSFLNTIDPGTIGGENGGHTFRLLMLLATVGGIFVVSSLIGLLTTGLSNRLVELRKGRSPVIVRGHAVILGWSEQVFTVVSELAKAANGKRSHVVILADEDKVAMEDQIHARVTDLGRTRVICRHGSPLKRNDLDLLSLDTARSIMVLSPAGDDADIQVIKALLLLKYHPWAATARPHVVAAVQDSYNLAAARLAGGDHTQIIDADDIAVRLVVQSHRQSGLSTVCTDLLDFSGNEIYMTPAAPLAGRAFGDVLTMFHHACPIGLYHADDRIALNPPMHTQLSRTDQVIVVAEDGPHARPSGTPIDVVDAGIAANVDEDRGPDRTLLIGWNARAPRIIELLDELVEPGSLVDIATSPPPAYPMGARANLTVGHKPCDSTSRRSLEELELTGYRHVIVLSDDTVDAAHADDRALVTLLHLRDFEEPFGEAYSIVTEMNDDANREVAQVAAADDFIVSNRLISLLMTQLAENRHLQGVFRELFDPSGSEIHLKPAARYVNPDVPVNFATVVQAARGHGEIAIGYRRSVGREAPPSYGVVLNPPKDASLTLGARDSVIVVAEN